MVSELILPFEVPPKLALDALIFPLILAPECVSSLPTVISPSTLESNINVSF